MNTTSLNKMALTSMLTRCKDILQRYAHDEKLSGNVPLPRSQLLYFTQFFSFYLSLYLNLNRDYFVIL